MGIGDPRKVSDEQIATWCRTLIPGYDPWKSARATDTFDAGLARRALCFFFDCLRHIEGEKAGTPFDLEPWQAAVIGSLFGWLDASGARRYREAFIMIARKNGKTALAAGIALYLLLCDGEAGAQVYSAAAEQTQAALVFRHAAGMVAQNAALRAMTKTYRAFKSLEVPATGGIFRALTAEAESKHGFNTSGAIVDELHAHPTRDLFDVLTTSTGARRQPLIVTITTSDFQRVSICNEKHEYASKVRDGLMADPAFLPVIYEAKVEDDWESPEVWRKANPNLGVSVSEEFLARECARAKESPAYLNTFLRLHLDVRTMADVRWFAAGAWGRCAGPVGWRELRERMKGRPCWAGLDLASTQDLCALSLYFPEEDNPEAELTHAVVPFFWAPKATALQREKRDRVPYLAWEREGALELTEGNVADYDRIRVSLNLLREEYDIREIRYDRWGAAHLVTQLQGDGFTLTEMGQGFASMSAPSKELDRLVASAQLRHGGHPLLAWMADNVMTETDAADNLKPSKAKSTEKIDGIVATVMGIGGAIVRVGNRSVYEDRGIIRL